MCSSNDLFFREGRSDEGLSAASDLKNPFRRDRRGKGKRGGRRLGPRRRNEGEGYYLRNCCVRKNEGHAELARFSRGGEWGL